MGAAGSEVAIHSATIALIDNDLPNDYPSWYGVSRTRSVINQNFLFGVCFILGGFYARCFWISASHCGGPMHNVAP